MITYHCSNLFPLWTGARRVVRAKLNVLPGGPLRWLDARVFGSSFHGKCGWASKGREMGVFLLFGVHLRGPGSLTLEPDLEKGIPWGVGEHCIGTI